MHYLNAVVDKPTPFVIYSPVYAAKQFASFHPLTPFLATLTSHLRVLPSFDRNRPPVTPFDATLPQPSISVANKRFTGTLTPLSATLTKNTGRGGLLLLTRNPKKDFYPERPLGVKDHASLTPCAPILTLRATISEPHLACAHSFRIGGCHE
jgi:hypothetical protein